jgi:hypothetical protein
MLGAGGAKGGGGPLGGYVAPTSGGAGQGGGDGGRTVGQGTPGDTMEGGHRRWGKGAPGGSSSCSPRSGIGNLYLIIKAKEFLPVFGDFTFHRNYKYCHRLIEKRFLLSVASYIRCLRTELGQLRIEPANHSNPSLQKGTYIYRINKRSRRNPVPSFAAVGGRNRGA